MPNKETATKAAKMKAKLQSNTERRQQQNKLSVALSSRNDSSSKHQLHRMNIKQGSNGSCRKAKNEMQINKRVSLEGAIKAIKTITKELAHQAK